ncbi:hypothetical protein MPSEU_000113600 [Mayamaea pseudoterrestris]|nr:hypothetical protein MPSEU_000113600 [Mayamaea pseudoterrestris]
MKPTCTAALLISFLCLAAGQQESFHGGSLRSLQITSPIELNVTSGSPQPSATPLTGRLERTPTISPMPSSSSMPSVAPSMTTGNTLAPTGDGTIVVATPTISTFVMYCGCVDCNALVWDTVTDETNATCGDRIDYVLGTGEDEEAACTLVAKQFPDACGACSPSMCDRDVVGVGGNLTTILPMPDTNTTTSLPAAPTDYFCDCDACTMDVLDVMTEGNATCGDRLTFLLDQGTNETAACSIISDQFPAECGVCNPFSCSSGPNEVATILPMSDVPSRSPSLDMELPTMAPSLASGASPQPSTGFRSRSTGPVSDTSGGDRVINDAGVATSVLTAVALLLAAMV